MDCEIDEAEVEVQSWVSVHQRQTESGKSFFFEFF